MHAIILAGGEGRRLGTYDQGIPKPMAIVDGKPMIERQVESLKPHGIVDIIVATGFKAEKITEFLGDGSRLEANIKYIHAPLEIGAGGAMKLALSLIPESEKETLVLAGDIMSDINFTELVAQHRRAWDLGFMPLITPVGLPGRYGVLHPNGPFSTQTEKDPVNAGVWCLDRAGILSFGPEKGGFDFTTGLPFGDIAAPYIHDGFWRDVGYPEDLKFVNDIFRMKREILEGNGSGSPEKG